MPAKVHNNTKKAPKKMQQLSASKLTASKTKNPDSVLIKKQKAKKTKLCDVQKLTQSMLKTRESEDLAVANSEA